MPKETTQYRIEDMPGYFLKYFHTSYLLHLSIVITQPWGRVKLYDGLLIIMETDLRSRMNNQSG